MNTNNKSIAEDKYIDRANKVNLINELTNKENEILYHIANGLTNKEISKQLFLSPLTIRNYIVKIFTKLKVSNRAEAAALAMFSEVSTQTELQKQT